MDRVSLTRKARLSPTRPTPDAGSQGGLVINQISGDGTGWVEAMPDSELVLLGPVGDVADGYPIVDTVAWSTDGVAVSRVDRRFRTETMELPGNVVIHDGGHLVLPRSVFGGHLTFEHRGRLSGATSLTLVASTLNYHSTASSNLTAPGVIESTNVIVQDNSRVNLYSLTRFTMEGFFKFSDTSRVTVSGCTGLVMQVRWFDLLGTSSFTWPCQLVLHIVTRFHIAAGASARADAVGYGSNGVHPSCLQDGSPGVGGSYGGFGGYSSGGTVARTPCGSFDWPEFMGAGGVNRGGETGGTGGGGLILFANQTVESSLEVHGVLSLNGGGSSAGGGTGGGIAIDTRFLRGSGTIRANGGNGGTSDGGGSGGRIAIHSSDTSTWSGTVQSCGGYYQSSSGGSYGHGGAGTVYWSVGLARAARARRLVVDNCNHNSDHAAQLSDEGRLLYELEYVTVQRKAKLSIRPPGTAPGARASFVVKALLGDGTGQLRVAPDTNMLLLGPLEDAPEMCVRAACGVMCCHVLSVVWLRVAGCMACRDAVARSTFRRDADSTPTTGTPW